MKSTMKHLPAVRILSKTLAVLSLLGLSTGARANDGGISWGGSPSLLKSHPSISMESEVVNITVGPENVLVDCRFVFRNAGAATTVRMGFPDDGEGESGFYSGDSEWSKEKAVGRFAWFKSWVDGAPTKTTLEKSSEPGKLWHAKAVSFPARSRRTVRDQYSVPIGQQIARNGIYWQTAYTLHTGSSWKGPIGRSEVIVSFVRPLGASKVRAIPFSKVPFVIESGDRDYVFERAMKPGVVVVSGGPGMPVASGKTLRWVKTNWRPTKKDDVFLLFDFKTIEQMRAEYEARESKLPYIDVYPVTRRLKASDLKGLSGEQVRLMRNAIYARQGRPFRDAKVAKYFGGKPWYRPKANWTEADENRPLGAVDAANAAFLLGFKAG